MKSKFVSCVSSLSLTFFAIFSLGRTAEADIVVREGQTSDDEFQAEAMANGHTPIAVWLAAEENRQISPALKEIFQARMIDAQSAWIRRTDRLVDLAAIDRFLDLEVEADWSKDERSAFSIFEARRQELSPLTRRSVAHFSRLRPEFPADVESVLFNGQEMKRAEFANLQIPDHPTRITLLSNVFAPVTLKLNGTETVWPRIQREPWVSESCTQISHASLTASTAITVLASDRCRKERSVAERFGIDRPKIDGAHPEHVAPFSAPAKPKAWIEKPWVWAAVGVLVTGAAIAITENQNRATVQPVVRENW